MRKLNPGEHRTSLLTLVQFIAANPWATPVLAKKLQKRFRRPGKYSHLENERWVRRNSQPSAGIAAKYDERLWREALEFGEHARKQSEPLVALVPFDMGAGGDYEFLYWLTRYRRPSTVVETGVLAGWTSHAFLAAIASNGSGKLYSSDFPYFRVPDAHNYIGVTVPAELREHWELDTNGDEVALPRILQRVEVVDIFHYDSDKSYSGREFAVGAVSPKLAPNGLIIVDDILNDSWFREYVEARAAPFLVLNERYGLVGEIG